MVMCLAHQWQEVVNSISYYLLLEKGSLNREPFFLCNIVLSLLNYKVDCTKKSEGKSASQRITYEKFNIIYDFCFVDHSDQS